MVAWIAAAGSNVAADIRAGSRDPSHGPVLIVPELPKTRSGKVMRRVARAAFVGADPGDLSALENPRAVEAIAALRLATTR